MGIGKDTIGVAALALAAVCAPAHADQPEQGTHLRVLFVGNSYTITVAPSVQGFANADPVASMFHAVAAVGGQTLAWHFASRNDPVYSGGRTLLSHLREQPWDVVVLQEFSTHPTRIGNVPEFRQAVRDLSALIRAEVPDAEIVLFETWARRSDASLYPGSFPGPADMQADLRANYGAAGQEVVARVAPVGDAWEHAYDIRPYNPGDPAPFSLHVSDTSHPGALGNYLSGAVLFELLFQRSVEGSTYTAGLDIAEALFLQQMATYTTGGSCAGDANGDRLVDFADLNAVLSLFGQQGQGLPGDLNRDGLVDFTDLNIVLSNYGRTC